MTLKSIQKWYEQVSYLHIHSFWEIYSYSSGHA